MITLPLPVLHPSLPDCGVLKDTDSALCICNYLYGPEITTSPQGQINVTWVPPEMLRFQIGQS